MEVPKWSKLLRQVLRAFRKNILCTLFLKNRTKKRKTGLKRKDFCKTIEQNIVGFCISGSLVATLALAEGPGGFGSSEKEYGCAPSDAWVKFLLNHVWLVSFVFIRL